MMKLTDPFKGDVSAQEIQEWINQFDTNDRDLVRPLLENFRYYSSEDVFELLDSLFKKLKDVFDINPLACWFVPTG
jgi:hypothetical protein